MTFKALAFTALMAVTAAFPAAAHHSFAMFDGSKTVTLKGTVKEFQWTYPHAWIVMMVPAAQGPAKQWAIELEAPSSLAKRGMVPKTLTPGMPISVLMHPLKDGSPGGSATGLSLTLPGGKRVQF
jgi:hypothetical protein